MMSNVVINKLKKLPIVSVMLFRYTYEVGSSTARSLYYSTIKGIKPIIIESKIRIFISEYDKHISAN